ncbi:MAG TPA: 2-oxoacid:acceptor oxidoreductase family protein [Terracidiphilus sp.]|nr:2-oxoacid:acceptor oxidoreductase family protein [Terracidiphilus sp.]
MSNQMVPEYEVSHARPKAFFERFTRKEELQHQTHYCPGCGHGQVHKMLARAIDELGIQNKTVLIGPVGCGVFTYNYFDVGNISAAHGRTPAVATAVRRSRPESIVIGYQGDGDLAAIGTAEIIHAANRGENITIIFVNNAIYSMTGGQLAPTSLLGQKSATSPLGRKADNEGYPLHISEMLATLEAPVYIERVALGDNKQIALATRAIKRAVENQVRGLGFSLIEVLSPCPTIFKMTPVQAQHWVRDVLAKTFPVKVIIDRTKERQPLSLHTPEPGLDQIPKILGVDNESLPEGNPIVREKTAPDVDLRVRVAGFGGQGVLLLGEVLAEAGLDAGLEVSWLPSYGPEMRSGTSNCHVRLSKHEIDSPMVTNPNVLVAMNEPSLRKFYKSVPPGGWILYNGDSYPEDCEQKNVHVLACPFIRLADELGDARAGNMVMLGALLEIAGVVEDVNIDAALRRLVKNPRWMELNKRALARGKELYRESCREVCHAS